MAASRDKTPKTYLLTIGTMVVEIPHPICAHLGCTRPVTTYVIRRETTGPIVGFATTCSMHKCLRNGCEKAADMTGVLWNRDRFQYHQCVECSSKPEPTGFTRASLE